MVSLLLWGSVCTLSLRCEAAAELAVIVFLVMLVRFIDSPFDSDSFSGFIANAFTRLHFGHLLCHLHGDQVEHSDKTLLLGGIWRQQVVH